MSYLKPAIVMQTDFTKDVSVCTMQGVCMMVDPELRVFDNTHSVKSFDTYQASTSLNYVINFWPKGTIFVSVIDPGVGTSRRACVAKLKNGSYVISPDNGSLTHLKKYFGIEAVRVIDEEKNRLQSTKKCNIFHGRDLFSYCAAKLASGIISFEEVGPEYPVEEIIEHEIVPFRKEGDRLIGMIDAIDYHFGLVCSNIPVSAFEEEGIKYNDILNVKIFNKKENKIEFEDKVLFCDSFGCVKKGEPLLMVSETIEIQIAVSEDNMTDRYNIGCGADWQLIVEKI